MLLPEKLDPIPGLDRSLLPAWVSDFGMSSDEGGEELISFVARRSGELFHITVSRKGVDLDDTFWVRYAEPAVNCLGMGIFEAEHPGMQGELVMREVKASFGQIELTDADKAMIARRKELTWKSPIMVYPN